MKPKISHSDKEAYINSRLKQQYQKQLLIRTFYKYPQNHFEFEKEHKLTPINPEPIINP